MLSQYYDMGRQTLWNPSNGTSRLFMSRVRDWRAELGLPSGIGPMRADECRLDPVLFKAFAEALLARHRSTGDDVTAGPPEDFVATVLVLAERAGIEVTWPPDDGLAGDVRDPAAGASSEGAWAAALRRKSREAGRVMPA
ncbi:DUF6086 family protein [Streptomyces sp. NPDC014894]|uniref:DUF6086 family protein n=1 Tax=unclassified Streptomyces TaxID=2593676 RepID=UPI0036F90CB9